MLRARQHTAGQLISHNQEMSGLEDGTSDLQPIERIVSFNSALAPTWLLAHNLAVLVVL